MICMRRLLSRIVASLLPLNLHSSFCLSSARMKKFRRYNTLLVWCCTKSTNGPWGNIILKLKKKLANFERHESWYEQKYSQNVCNVNTTIISRRCFSRVCHANDKNCKREEKKQQNVLVLDYSAKASLYVSNSKCSRNLGAFMSPGSLWDWSDNYLSVEVKKKSWVK